jgi:tetratricopeptide (TPR) repeat protein
MKIKLCTLVLLVFSFGSTLIFGQLNYELLYLERNYDGIIEEASQQDGEDDFYWHALALNVKGETLLSSKILEKGISVHSDNQKLEFLLANLYYESGNFVKALPLLEKYSSSLEAFIRYIEILEFQNRYSEAIGLLENRLDSDSLNLSLLIHLGDNYYQLDSNKIALRYYKIVSSINPDDQATANKLASILVKEKEYEQAILVCDEILSKDSLNRKFIRIKGSASFSNQDFKTSNMCFGRLYEIGDSSLFVLKHLGLGEIEEYLFAESRKHLLGAYKKDPNIHEVCFALGRGFFNSRTPEKGMMYLDRLDSLLQPDTAVLIAIILEKQTGYSILKEYDKALGCFQQANAFDPQPKYLFFMASIYQHRLNDPQKALDLYTEFLEVLPPSPKLSDSPDLEGQKVITLRSAAEHMITELKEELFFEGKLE